MLPSAPRPNSPAARARTQPARRIRARRALLGPNAPRRSHPSQNRAHLARTPTPGMEDRVLSVPRGHLIMYVRWLPFFFYSDTGIGIDFWRDGLLLLLLRILLGQHGCDVVLIMPIRSRLRPRLPICLCLLCEQPQRRLVLQPVFRRYLPYVFSLLWQYELL